MNRTEPSAAGVTVASVRQLAPFAPCSCTGAGGAVPLSNTLVPRTRGRASASTAFETGAGAVAAVPVVNQVERSPRAVRAVPAATVFCPALPSRMIERTRPEGYASIEMVVSVPA